jgi:hypothetical protein
MVNVVVSKLPGTARVFAAFSPEKGHELHRRPPGYRGAVHLLAKTASCIILNCVVEFATYKIQIAELLTFVKRICSRRVADYFI